jgi:ATP-dependent Clp protease protease subunit
MISQLSSVNEIMRRIIVSGTIREESAFQFLEQLTAMEYLDITRPITIYIDTYGGDLNTAMLMYDAIRMCAAPITTLGIGKVMSAGTLIMAAGDPGFRLITKNTRVMIHPVSGGIVGDLNDMNCEIEEINKSQELFCELLSIHSNKTKKQVMEDMKKTNYMTATQAVKYGLVDRVMPFKKLVKPNLNKKSPKIRKAQKKTK